MRFIAAVVLFAAALSGQSLSKEVNRELPKWLRFGGEYRARLEGFGNGGFRAENEDAWLLNRVRLNLTIQPAGWMKFVFQGQDARIFWNTRVPSAPPYKDSMDLRMGYVEFGDLETKPFGLRAGRQELVFGEQRLVGHTSWSNTARTFDAVRATARWHDWRFDAFASSVVIIRDGEFNRPVTGSNFHGLYASSAKAVPKATVDAYVLWRIAPNLDFKTIGTRWAGKLPAGFDYSIEMAAQTGRVGAEDLRAWAGHWLAGYAMPKATWKPRWIAEYNYASGDKDPLDSRRGTFDSLYPTPHEKYGMADQVGWRNIHHLRLGIEAKPHAGWTVYSNFHDWWLASPRDALYNAPGNAIARVPDGSGGRHVGEEIDFGAAWTPTPQILAGAGIGHVFPGRFLKKATPGKPYTYPYLLLTYTF